MHWLMRTGGFLWGLLVVLIVALASALPTTLRADCNGNGSPDSVDVENGTSEDCNSSGVPDECEQSVLRLGQASVFTELKRLSSLFVAGDLNGDGLGDFITGTPRFDGSSIEVYLNEVRETGKQIGEFAGPATYEAAARLRAIELGDIDHDGDLDVIAASRSSVEILSNTGTGSGILSTSVRIPLPADVTDLSVTDISGNGSLDVVVLHSSGEGPYLSIFLNEDGKGSFERASRLLNEGAGTEVLDTADMDGDGDADIIMADAKSAVISIFFNEGCLEADDCTFSADVRIPFPEAPVAIRAVQSVGVAADLVVATESAVVILRNGGDGRAFETATFSAAAMILAVSDLDSDGDLDVILGGGIESLSVLINDGDGGFDFRIDLGFGAQARAFFVGNFGGDGRPDLAVVSSGRRLGILASEIERTIDFDSKTISLVGEEPHTTALADFDGDGDLDLVTGNGLNKMLSVLINEPRGVLTVKANIPVNEAVYSMAHSDFDRDGDLDLVVGSFGAFALRFFENDGKASFSEREVIDFGRNSLFLIGVDVNGDEWPDLLSSADRAKGFAVALNDGAGGFLAPTEYTVGTGVRNVAPADFDRDGDLDVVVANSTSRNLSVLTNRGNGVYDEQIELGAGGSPFFVTVGDWDSDGEIDIATASLVEESVGILLNNGDGTFTDVRLIPIAAASQSLATADMNLDGRVDLVSSNANSNNVSVLLNIGEGQFVLAGHFGVGMEPRFAPVGLINDDEAPDILAASRTSMDVTVLLSLFETGSRSFLKDICTLVDFEELALSTRGTSPEQDRLTIKYTMPARRSHTLIPTTFQNTKRFPLHEVFLSAVFPEHFSGLTTNLLIGLSQVRATRDYYIGAIERVRSGGETIVIYSIVTAPARNEVLTLEEVRAVHETMSEAVMLRPLLYAPDPGGGNPLARDAARSWKEPGFPIFLDTVDFNSAFIPYTLGVSYGRVRIFRGDEFDAANESGRFTFQDIVVVDHSPRDINGVVGGVITEAPQGALSHVSVRTASRGTPNAFVDKAIAIFEPFQGKLVRVEITESDYSIEEATIEEAEALWAMRKGLPAARPLDAEYRGLDRFEEMDVSLSKGLEARFGGKAVGLARLQTILTGPFEQYREHGFAIPLAYYVDFMNGNTRTSTDGRELSYQAYLEELFETERFRTDSEFRFEALGDFRDFARSNGEIPEGLVAGIAARIEEVFESRQVMVRHRSSSNLEDILEFNGAGLYESTSVRVEDTLDEADVDSSHCDPERNNERTIERALKKVWTSLWTFRAHEERAFFQIPQLSAAMGILVNRAFLDEDANGVAFTGDFSNPRGGCYVVTVQVGEESVVSPAPGILPEVDILEVTGGQVVNIVRVRSSTLVADGEVVLSDKQLEELGALMWHVDEGYPIDTGDHERDDVLLDMEFKLEKDGSLAVKQIRPFLIPGERPESLNFELVVPTGAETCGTMNLESPSGNPKTEYDSKSSVRFRAGTYILPSDRCVFIGDLFEEVVVGPAQEVATPEGPGLFGVSELPGLQTGNTRYAFKYEQRFSLSGGRTFEIRLFNLDFTVRQDGTSVENTLVLDEKFITFNLEMRGFHEDTPLTVTYSSCGYSQLPLRDVAFELEDGTSVKLSQRFLPPKSVAKTGPAALEAANLVLGGDRRRVTDYWKLVYSSGRHNTGVTYWVVLDPPAMLPGVQGDVHVVALSEADPPELADIVAEPRLAAAAYLDANFETIARPAVLLFTNKELHFRRGDANGDGNVDISDPIRVLKTLFRDGEPVPCDKAVDVNDDGRIDITDAIRALRHLFGTLTLPAPGRECGVDPTPDRLGCERAAGCVE